MKPLAVHVVSCVTVSSLRTLPQGPCVSSNFVFSHWSSHRVTPICTLRAQPTSPISKPGVLEQLEFGLATLTPVAGVDNFSRRLSLWQQLQQQRRSQNHTRLHPAVPPEFLAVFDNQVAAAQVRSFSFCFHSTASQISATAWFVSVLRWVPLNAFFQCSELMPALCYANCPSFFSPFFSLFSLLFLPFFLTLFLSFFSPFSSFFLFFLTFSRFFSLFLTFFSMFLTFSHFFSLFLPFSPFSPFSLFLCRKRAKGKAKTERVPITQTSLPLKITIMMTTRSNWQMLVKLTTTQLQTPIKLTITKLTPEVTLDKKLWAEMSTRKTTRFLRMLLWMTSLFPRQLNWMQLLFLSTRGTTILTQKLAHSWSKPMYKLAFPSERRKVKARARARANFLFVLHVCHQRIVNND